MALSNTEYCANYSRKYPQPPQGINRSLKILRVRTVSEPKMFKGRHQAELEFLKEQEGYSWIFSGRNRRGVPGYFLEGIGGVFLNIFWKEQEGCSWIFSRRNSRGVSGYFLEGIAGVFLDIFQKEQEGYSWIFSRRNRRGIPGYFLEQHLLHVFLYLQSEFKTAQPQATWATWLID